ncbi:MAG: hypothetical protein ACXWV0_07515, partial [Flavisolibacter sp.]
LLFSAVKMNAASCKLQAARLKFTNSLMIGTPQFSALPLFLLFSAVKKLAQQASRSDPSFPSGGKKCRAAPSLLIEDR